MEGMLKDLFDSIVFGAAIICSISLGAVLNRLDKIITLLEKLSKETK